MKKPLRFVQSLFLNQFRVLSITALMLVLLGISQRAQAQLYYINTDNDPFHATTYDALLRMNYNGSDTSFVKKAIFSSPSLIALDAAHSRAFVYSALAVGATPSINIINLTTGNTTATFTPNSGVVAMRYNPADDYIYYLTSDADYKTQATSDALNRIKADGTGNQVLISALCKTPVFMTADFKQNRVFVYDALAATRSIFVISLTNNTVSSKIDMTPTTRVVSGAVMQWIDYDDVTDNVYYMTNDQQATKTTAGDALYKIRSDGTGAEVVKDNISISPTVFALDLGNDRIYFYDALTAVRAIKKITISNKDVATVLDLSNLPKVANNSYGTIGLNAIVAPQRANVVTANASTISSTFATLGGSIVQSDATVTERGILYSTSNATPTVGGSGVTKATNGNGTGDFSQSITGLSASTTYYERAYAISGAGVAYGAIVTFSTTSNNANLSAFTISSGTLSPVFASGTTSYTASVTYDKTTITLTPNAAQANATIKVNNTAVTSGTATGAISLNPGSNVITTVVTAQDGTTTKTYTTTITKDKSPQTITFNALNAKTYGDADFTLGAVAGSTLAVTYTSDNDNVATVSNTGAVHIVGVGTVNIIAAQSGNTTYLAASNVSQQLTVNKAVLTYTADAKTRDYGAANPTFTGTVTGFVNGESQASATTGSMAFTSTANATSPVTIDNNTLIKYPITGSGLSAANYSFVQAAANSTALTINKIAITYTVQPATKVYGAANPAFTTVFTGIANSEAIGNISTYTQATTANAASVVGSYPVTLSGLTALNYTFTPASSNNTALTIAKADLTFTAQAATKHYGEANPTLSGSITGYVNNETAATALSGTATYNTTATTTSGVGGYPVTLSGITAANYNITAASANSTALSITQNTLKYVASPASRAFNTANPSVTGTVTGFLNGDNLANATTGTLSFNTAVTATTPVGTYAINGQGLTSANYTIEQNAANASAFSIYLASNGNLSNLTLSQGNNTLSPAFTGGTNNYTATVATGITSLTVTPTLSDNNALVTVNGSGVTSGTASGSISLNIGANTIPVNVTAQDGTTTNPYNIIVTRLPSSDATLNSFVISTGTPSPDAYNVYRSNVGNTVTSFDVTAVIHEANATLMLNNNPVTSGVPATVPLNLGENSFNLVVTAQDGTTKAYYGIVITRALNAHNLLNSLTVSEGTLSPAFNSATKNYTVNVSNASTNVSFTPTFDATASGSNDGFYAPSGQPFTTIPLQIGDNAIPITIYAQNGTPNQYNVTVHRAVSTDATLADLGILTTNSGLDVPFSPGTYTYNTTVTYDVTGFTLKPVATNDGATITINGSPLNTFSGNTIPLQYFSATEPMVIKVTAGDTSIKKTYTINVVREFNTNNLLQSLTMNFNGTLVPLNPVFDPAVNDYTLVVNDPNVNNVVIAPVPQNNAAYLRVGGVPVNVGSSRYVPLQGGANIIPVSVEAIGGGFNIYNITITRAYSSDAGLINVIVSGNGGYSSIINQANNNLTATAPNSVTAIALIPNASDPGGTVLTVNGYAITDGASGSLPLAVGDNVFTVGITAADNSNTQYYTVHVNRLPFVDVSLSSLAVSKGTLTPAFTPGTLNYSVLIGSADESVDITPVSTLPGNTITVGAGTITPASPTYTQSSTFAGSQNVNITVRAPDGVNFTRYRLTVVHPANNQALLGGIQLSQGTVSPAFSRTIDTYTAAVPYAASTIALTPQSAEANGHITVTANGNTTVVGPGNTAIIALNVGANVISSTVTSPDNSSSKTYTVTITRGVANTDGTLASLNVSDGTLSPAFGSATTSYTVNVNYATTQISVFPKATSNLATVKIGMVPVSTGLTVPLNVGSNTITTTVTAEDGTEHPYAITVNRSAIGVDATLASLNLGDGTLSPVFDAATTTYTASVDTSNSILSISPITNDPYATVKVNGADVDLTTGLIDVHLDLGSNTIAIDVTAQNGTDTKSYELTVTRAIQAQPVATLADLTIDNGNLTPAFDTNTFNYTAEVTDDISIIYITPTLTDPSGTVIINGDTSTCACSFGRVNLNYGNNLIPIAVTSADGTVTKTYNLTIYRDISADLLSLDISHGNLSPKTPYPGITHFEAAVDNAVTSVTLTPKTLSSQATIKVNDQDVTSGTASPAFLLNVGDNTFIVKVTSPDVTIFDTVLVHRHIAAPVFAGGGSTAPPVTKTYTVNTIIAPLSTTITGVDAPGSYSPWPKVIDAPGVDSPNGMASDAAGNLYVSNLTNGYTYKLPAGGGTPVAVDTFSYLPFGVAVNKAGTNLYIADAGHGVVANVPLNGVGSEVDYPFYLPTGVAVDEAGNLFVTDLYTHTAWKIPAGDTVAVALDSNLTVPMAIAVDKAGNVYIADQYDPDNKIVKIPFNDPSNPVKVGTGIQSATDIKVDADGNLFVTQGVGNVAIKKILAGTDRTVTLGTKFLAPTASALDPAGNIFVSDNGDGVIKQLIHSGGYTISPELPDGLTLNDTTGTISGKPTVASLAKDYTLSAYNGGGSVSSNINITVVTAPDASLASLTLSTGTAVSHPTATSYTATIPYVTGAFTITPTAIDANAEIRVAGNVVVSGSPSQSLTLGAPVGSTLTVPIIVTAPDGTTIKSYTITVTRDATGAPNNAGITRFGLSPSATLVQVPNTNNFTTTVDGAVSSVLLISTVSVAGTTVSVNGVPVTSGVASDPIALNTNGATVITAVATALNGTTKTYTITVSKTGSSNTAMKQISLTPGSSIVQVPNTSNYTTTVSSGISSVKQTFTTADSGATIKVNGVTVPSGTASGDIALNATGTTTITTVVTAANGTTTKTYTLTISKTGSSNASLIRIGLNPSSTLSAIANTNNFTTTIDGSVTSVQQVASTSDAGAVMVVNGVVTASGVPSAPIALNATGTTVITTVVTAENGVTAKTYTVTISKTGSSNATLASFGLNPSATFVQVPTTSNFTTTVNHAVNQVQLKLSTTDSNATMLVNGVAAISGMPTGYLALNATGTTTIPVVVTAANGVTTKTYNFTISRTGSSDVAVDHFGLSPSATIVQEPNTANYSTTVNAATGTVQLKTVLKDAGATLKVNGISVIPGAATNPIALNVSGVTNISVVVTAENGFTTKTYTIAISKTGSSNATILLFKLNPATTLTQIPNTGNFTATVPASVTSVQLIPKASDADAMISVNGETVVSEAASSSIPLNAGATTVITTVVTAGNGTTTKTYTLTITSTPSPESGFNTLESTGIAKISNDNISNTLFVHQALSPNGDGQNDVLLVDGLQNYSNNHLTIMNAAGQLVFETLNYNTSGNVFDGHSNKTGTMQKPGTYYYSLEYKDGNDTKRKTGYIILKY